jgi:hypothetical protein
VIQEKSKNVKEVTFNLFEILYSQTTSTRKRRRRTRRRRTKKKKKI